MTVGPVLARGAAIVAEIHHSHGIKAALAVNHLSRLFPHWTAEFWADALVNARWFEEPLVDQPVSMPQLQIAPERARVLLERSVFPRAYGAIRSWAAVAGADDIVEFYLEQAAAQPGYLGHRLSILLALGEAWPLFKDTSMRDLYLDRLTEFILACRFTARHEAQPSSTAGWQEACTAALVHPGFFGHNLICLAWIGRNRARLTTRQSQASLGWVVDAASQTFADEEDNVTMSQATCEMTQATLDAELQALLLRGVRNIHLLTLADGISWLWDDLAPESRPWLVSVARKYAVATM